ncbi:MAG: MFS transporter [Streptosporangiales bacterium]|nr:MFS transporter [Streptosporangiales bacterium]
MDGRRDFRLLLASAPLTFGSFGLLLPVVPLWAEHGGAPPAGVGATNAAFLFVTVVTQVAAPRILPRLGHRESLVLGAVLLGLPVFAYPLTTSLPALVAISALRGIGFALVVVTSGALVARLLPAHRRGRGVGLFGLSIGIPNVLWLPAGPWAAEVAGFAVVFVLGGVLTLAGASIVVAMRIRTRERGRSRPGRDPDTADRPVRLRSLATPFAVMCVAALASSAFVTFLPAAFEGASGVTAGLFAYGVGGLAGRWLAGELGDRYRRPVLLVPGVFLSVAGLLGLLVGASTDAPTVVLVAGLAGGLAFGVGFGAVQNTTMTAMFDRVPPRGFDLASTAWNMAFDAGTAAGSLAIGVAAGLTGYPVTFAITAGLLAATLPLAVTLGRQTRAVDP